MRINPDKIVRRYENCFSRGAGNLLKQVFLKLMVNNFNGDTKLASNCSEILSAIDADSVGELAEEPLAVLDKHLMRVH